MLSGLSNSITRALRAVACLEFKNRSTTLATIFRSTSKSAIFRVLSLCWIRVGYRTLRSTAYLADQVAAGGYPLCQFRGQTVDKRMVEPLFFRSLRHFRNVFEDGVRHSDNATYHHIGLDVDALGEFLPLIFADIPDAVFVSNFH